MIWSRIGAESDAQVLVSPVGAPGVHGYFNSTLRDLARFGLLYTPSWKTVAKEQVIPDALIKRIQKEGRPAIFKAGIYRKFWDAYLGEGLLCETRQFDIVTRDGDFGKAGHHGQALYISPSQDLVVASFATGEEFATLKFARQIAKGLRRAKARSKPIK